MSVWAFIFVMVFGAGRASAFALPPRQMLRAEADQQRKQEDAFLSTMPESVMGAEVWRKYVDPVSGRPFYFNTKTKSKSWDDPTAAKNADGSVKWMEVSNNIQPSIGDAAEKHR